MITVNGEERGLALTVRSLSRVSALCPDHDMSRFEELFSDGIDAEVLAELVSVMSDCYERRKAREDRTEVREPVSAEDVLDMDLGDLAGIARELTAVVAQAMHATVEAEPVKKPGAAGAAA